MTGTIPRVSPTRPLRWAAGFFLILGLVVNRYTLGWVAGDGAIESLLFNAVILAAQGAFLGVGIYLWCKPVWGTVLNLTMMAFVLVGMLVVGELSARVFVFGLAGLDYRAMDSTADFGHAGLIQASDTPGLIFELKPNHQQLYALKPWKTNRHAMRYREIPKEKGDNAVRVAVLGDSFTAPSGVALEESFHARLEALSAAVFPDWELQFLNFGVPGYQMPQYVAQLEHRALGFAPDLILLGFCAENDHLGMPPNYLATPYVPPTPRSGFWRSILLELFLRLNHMPLVEMDKSLDENATHFVDTQFEALARRAGSIPVVVAYLANMPRPADDVAALARKHGFSFVDVSSDFQDASLREYSIYYPIDAHPNGQAHGRFAATIFEHLSRTGILARCVQARAEEVGK